MKTAAATHELVSATGAGRVASASRTDYAEAAAVVATTPGHAGSIYELGGDEAWDYRELARAMSEVLDETVVYREVSPAELDHELAAAGIDDGTRGFLVALDADIARGDLAEVTHDLSRLVGHPTTPLATTFRTVL